MDIVTLTSDWGEIDFYSGVVKATLLKSIPGVQIIDISHHISRHNHIHAAYVLKNCYKHFPDKTIHIIAVDTDVNINHLHTIVEIDNQYFIGKDNGVFSLMFDHEPDKIVAIDIAQQSNFMTFAAKDIFCTVAAKLSEGVPPEELGDLMDHLTPALHIRPTITSNQITGKVIHIDAYHNLITNIHIDLFEEQRKGRDFQISFHNDYYKIKKIQTMYNECYEADILAIFGSSGFLEIAMYQSKADELLNMKVQSHVIIKFNTA